MSSYRAMLTLGCLWLVTACQIPVTTASDPQSDANLSSRASAKTTCPEAVLTRSPRSMQRSDRRLVPFSSTELAVETDFNETQSRASRAPRSEKSVELISGGFVDDLTESYDDLHVVRNLDLGGRSIVVFEGSLLTNQIQLAIWHEKGTVPPCDVHAVIATNLSRATFGEILRSVRVERGHHVAEPRISSTTEVPR